MRAPTALTSAAFATTAALLLSGCGGNAMSSEPIKGAQTAATTSAAPSASDPAGGSTITLPEDDVIVFEGRQTGDPRKDAVLTANAQFIRVHAPPQAA